MMIFLLIPFPQTFPPKMIENFSSPGFLPSRACLDFADVAQAREEGRAVYTPTLRSVKLLDEVSSIIATYSSSAAYLPSLPSLRYPSKW